MTRPVQRLDADDACRLVGSDLMSSPMQQFIKSFPTHPPRERCLFFYDQSCTVCVRRCLAGALTETGLDNRRCQERLLLTAAYDFRELGPADVCGKCASGPRALRSAV